jgi:hypothetical protein
MGMCLRLCLNVGKMWTVINKELYVTLLYVNTKSSNSHRPARTHAPTSDALLSFTTPNTEVAIF